MHKRHLIARAALGLGLFSLTQFAFAGAFQLFEQDSAGTGNYHAGAAVGDNPGNSFYNAATMTQLHHAYISVGGVLIPASVKFNGTITESPNPPVTTPAGGVKSRELNLVPNMHIVVPVNNRVVFGLGVTVPFGLGTDYPASSAVAVAATKTELMTINVNPNLAFAVTKWLSIGVGFDMLYGQAIYDSMPGGSNFKNKLSGVAPGYNLGVLILLPKQTKLGISYRSQVTVHATGRSEVTNGTPTTVSAALPLPPTTIISLSHQLTRRITLLASAFYTQWSVFSNLTLNNTALFPGTGLVIHENYRNTWNLALGTNIVITPKIILKLGFGHDQTPTRNGFRDIRLPDASRYVAAIGLHYQYSSRLGIDGGWTHLFMKKANINNSQSSSVIGIIVPLTVGTARSNVDVIGMQVTYQLDK